MQIDIFVFSFVFVLTKVMFVFFSHARYAARMRRVLQGTVPSPCRVQRGWPRHRPAPHDTCGSGAVSNGSGKTTTMARQWHRVMKKNQHVLYHKCDLRVLKKQYQYTFHDFISLQWGMHVSCVRLSHTSYIQTFYIAHIDTFCSFSSAGLHF